MNIEDPSAEVPMHDVPFSLERIVFFSDAVFAIAITLLAIEIRLPQEVEAASLNDALLSLTPHLFSYGLSFATIGLYWLAHWRRYDYVEHADERLAAINLVHLAFIALIPFPTALLGEHGDQPMPVIVYALVISAAGIAGTWSWLYAERRGLTTPGLPQAWIRLAAVRGLSVPVIFLASLPLLLIHPFVTEAAWLLVFPLQTILARRLRRSEHVAVPTPGDRG